MLTLVERQASRAIREIPAPITNRIELSPAQRLASGYLLEAIHAGGMAVLNAAQGAGRTTILRHVQALCQGVLVGAREFMSVLAAHQPAAVEEAFVSLMEGAMDRTDIVLVDDFHLINAVVNSCEYPRTFLLDLALTATLDRARARRKQVVLAIDKGEAPSPMLCRSICVEVGSFKAADYECICRAYLPPRAADNLDYAEIHRFAPELNAHQLKTICAWLADDALTTDRFTSHLAERGLASNVELEEVAPVQWTDLKGFDDVIQELETKIALPFENRALAAELQLKPKRGVLLAGPPGTGKTTIGRALATRLKGKFFMIDGTVIAGTEGFYGAVRRIFNAAKRNAPSVVFIDDGDLIFESGDNSGFYRYLLTMLDGLESASAERVCVIITAMNVHSLPEAVLRSGRIELWLETRLPDLAARIAILNERLAQLPPPLGTADVRALAEASAKLTGADLRAVVEDGKLLFARDKATGAPLRPIEDYFRRAISAVRVNQRDYARRRPSRTPPNGGYGFIGE